MRLLLCLLLAGLLNAQAPIQVIPCREAAGPANLPPCVSHTSADNLRLLQESMQQGVEVVRFVREMELKEKYLDLARRADRRAQEEHELLLKERGEIGPGQNLDLRNRLFEEQRTHNQRLSQRQQLADWKVNKGVIDAFSHVRSLYPDFDALLPAIEVIAAAVKADWQKASVDEYLESLYMIAKHASFATKYRDVLLRVAAEKQPAAPEH